MSKTTLQLRRGSTTDNQAFTGALGEVVVDTTLKTLVVHDGSTQGGNYIAPLTSPAFAGIPTAPTPTAGTNTTQLATTQFVTTAIAAGLPSISVGAPNAASGSGAISYASGVLKYTPPDLSGYLTSGSITSGLITSVLGYTPYDANANTKGFLTSGSITGAISVQSSVPSGALTYNSGTGQFNFTAPVQSVNSLTGVVNLTTDNVPVGLNGNLYLTLPNLSTTLTSGAVAGVTVSGTSGAQILGDFSNATLANRTIFSTTSTNSSTGIYATPNGTNGTASWQAANSSVLTNASTIGIQTNGSTDVRLVSGANGSGTYLPLTIYNNGTEQVRVTPTGFVGVGNNNPQYKLDVTGDINVSGAVRTNGTAGISGQVLQSTGSGATWASISSSLPNVTELDSIASVKTAQAATASISGTTMSVTGGMAAGQFIVGMSMTNNNLPTTLVQSGNQVQTTTFTASVAPGTGIYSGLGVLTVTSIPTNYGITPGMAITGGIIPAGTTITGNISGTGNSLNSTWTISSSVTVTATTLVATTGSTTFTGTISGNQLLVTTAPTGLGIYTNMVLTGGLIPQAGTTNQVTISMIANFIGTTTATYVSGTIPTVGMLISGTNIPLGTYVTAVSGSQGTQLKNVAITDTNGLVTFNPLAFIPQVGQPVVVSGIAPSGSTIQSYSNPTTYYVSASPAPTNTSFRLTDTIANAYTGSNNLTTTVTASTTLSVLTFTANTTFTVSNPVTSQYSIAVTGITYTQGYNVYVLNNNNGATGTNAVINSSTMQVLGSTTGTYAGNLASAIFTLSGISVSTAGTYYNVVQSSTSGGGGGAVFTITKSGSGTAYSGNTTITVVNPGGGYQVGDTITIPGTSLGGGSPAQNLTMTVALVTGFTQGMQLTGTGVSTGTSISLVNACQFNAILNGTNTITVTQYGSSVLASVAYASATTISFTATTVAIPAGTVVTILGTPTGSMNINSVVLTAGQTYYIGVVVQGGTTASLYATQQNAITSTSPLSISNGTTTGASFSFAGSTFGSILQNMVVSGVGIPNGTYITSGNGIFPITLSQPVFSSNGLPITVTGLSYSITPSQTVASTTINGTQTGAGSSWTISASPTTPTTTTLSGVSIVGTAGQFTCNTTAYPMVIGMSVTITGLFGGGGAITTPAYASGTTYYIIATNGYTSFTLSSIAGGSAITTTAGTPSGLTYTVNGAVITGGLATVNFLPQLTIPYTVGSTVTVQGITPIGYNGIYTVLAATNSSVSYANPTAGNQTAAGTVGANIANPTTIIGVNNATITNATINNGGSGAGNILTVGSVTSGSLSSGMVLSGGTTTLGTTIVNQLTSSSTPTATTNIYSTNGTLISGGAIGTNSFVTQLGANVSIADVGNIVSGIGIPAGTTVTTINNDSIVTLASTAATTTATSLVSPSIIDNAGSVQFNQVLTGVAYASATTISYTATPVALPVGTGVQIVGTGIAISATMTIGGNTVSNGQTYYVGSPVTTTSATLYSSYANAIAGGTGSTITYTTLTATGTSGQFSITAQSPGTFTVGATITLTGNPAGVGGSISGFASGTSYLISATNGTSTFTLTTLGNAPITTTLGTITGLTVKLGGPLTIASPITLTSALYGTLTITNTTGGFSFSIPQGSSYGSSFFNVGTVIIITGTPSDPLAITSYTSGTAYKISATNGSSTFTLTTLAGGAITTVAEIVSGLSFNVISTTGAVFQTTTPFTPTVGQSITLSGTNTNTSTNVLTGVGINNNTGVFSCTSNTIFNNTAVVVTGTNTNSTPQSLTGVSVTGVSGTFNATAATLQVGQTITISGNATNAPTTLSSVAIGSSLGTFTCASTVLLPNQQIQVSGTMTSPNTLLAAQTTNNLGVFNFANTRQGPNTVQLVPNQTVTVTGSATSIAINSPIITGTQGQFNIGTVLTTPALSSASGALSGQFTFSATSGLAVGQPVQILGNNAGVGITLTFSSITGGQLVVSSTGTALAAGTALVISTATSISGNITINGVAVSSLVSAGAPVTYYVGSPTTTTNITLYSSLSNALSNTSPLTVAGTTATGAVFYTLPGTFVANSGNTIANSLYYISATNTTSTFTLTDTLSDAFNNIPAITNTSAGPTQINLGTVSYSNATTIAFSTTTSIAMATGTPFYVLATTSPSATIGGVLVAPGQIYYIGNATTSTAQLFATYSNAINNVNPLAISNATFGSSQAMLAGQILIAGTNMLIGQPVTISGTFGAATTISGTTTFTNTTGGLTLGTATAAGALQVGQLINVSGTQAPSGTITGYANPTTYVITATNGSTTLTLANPTGYVLPTVTGTGATTVAPAAYGTLTTTSTAGAFSISTPQAAGTFYPGAVITATGTLSSSVTISGLISLAISNTLGFSNVPTFTLGTSTTLTVGQAITISGTFSSGSLTGYNSAGTTYYIITTNGTTTFSVSATQGGNPVTATASSGNITGLTVTTTPIINYYSGKTYIVTATNTTSTFTLVDGVTGQTLVTTNSATVSGLTFSISVPTTTSNNIQFTGSNGVGTGTALASVAYSNATVISFTALFAPIPAGTPVYVYGANTTFFIGSAQSFNGQVYYLGNTTTTTASLYTSAFNAINNINALTISNTSTSGLTFVCNQFVVPGTSVTISGASITGNLSIGGLSGAALAGQTYYLGLVTPYTAQLFNNYQNAVNAVGALTITGSTTTGATFTTNSPNTITTVAQAVTGLTFAVTPQIYGYSNPTTYYVMSTNGGTTVQLTNSLANALASNPTLQTGTGTSSGLTTTAVAASISGYTSGSTYYIVATNGSTTATLSSTPVLNLTGFAYGSSTTVNFASTGYTLSTGMSLVISGVVTGTLQIGGTSIATGQTYYIGSPFTATSATLYASLGNAQTSTSPLTITNGTVVSGVFTLGGAPIVTTSGNAYNGLTFTLNSIAAYTGTTQTYYIGQTNSYNTFTLSTGPNSSGALITAQGSLSGLTFNAIPQFISGYSSPSTYYVTATNTTTTFTLSATPGGVPITTVVGTPTGLTYSISAPSLLGYTSGTTYYITSTNGTNSFTLSNTPLGTPLTTTAGIPSGLTFTVQAPAITPAYSNPTTYYITSTNGTNIAQLSLSNPGVSTILGQTLTSVAYSTAVQISFGSTGIALAAGTLITITGTAITGNMTIGGVAIAASQTYYIGNTTTTTASLFNTYANAIANTNPLTISNGSTTGATFTASQGIVTQGSSTTISFPTTGSALQNGTLVTISGNNITGTITIGGTSLVTGQTYYMGNVTATSASLYTSFAAAVAGTSPLAISAGTTAGAQFTALGGAPISTVPGTLTGITMTAYTATLTYPTQSIASFPVGGSMQVAGFTAQPAFNGTWVVQGCTTRSVTYAIYTTTALTGTTMGTITGASNLYMTVTLSNNLTTQATGTYTFYDGGAAGSNSFGITTATNLAIGQIITGTGIPTGTTIAGLTNMVDATGSPSNVGIILSNSLTQQATGTYNAYNVGGAGTYTVSGSTQLVTSTAMTAQSFTVTPSQTVAGTTIDGTTASINGGNTIFTPTNNSTSVAITNPIQVLLIKNGVRLTGWLNKSRPMWNTITKYGDYTVNSSGQIVFTSPPQVGDIVASTVLVGNSTNPIVANYPFNAVDVVTGT